MSGHRGCMAQVPAAHGRYIVCSSGMCSAKLVGQVLSKRFPDYQFNASQDAWPIPDFDTSKARVFYSDFGPGAKEAHLAAQSLQGSRM